MMELLQNPALLVAVAASVVGPALVVLLGWARDRRTSDAQAKRDIAEARRSDADGTAGIAGVVLRWSEGLRDELAKVKAEVKVLHEQIDRLERQNRALRRHNEALTAQVLVLGGTPVAMPED